MVGDANRRGYEHLLRAFWDEARLHGLPLPCEQPVSAASFCEARHKITPEHLRDLLYEIAWAAPEGSALGNRLWKGRRVFAVDGTRINLQRDQELDCAFGTPEGAHCPQVLLSVLVDVCARVPMDLEVSGYAGSEREHLSRMLTNLEAGDILVLDRGYPSHELLQALSQASVDFLIRVPASNSFTAIDKFQDRKVNESVAVIEVPVGADPTWRPLRVRLVRLDGPDEQPSFYVTSLPFGRFTRRDLANLYHMRWEIEEFFKLLKSSYAGQGQYRSKSAAGVIQEIHATVLFLAIARLCSAVAASQVKDPETRPSQKGAVLALAAFLTRILLEPDQQRAQAVLATMVERIATTPAKRRPGRSTPRRSFKPSPRWGPAGRRGA